MYGYQDYFNLTPSQVLEKVPEVEIFEFILKQPIILNKKQYTSPFRVDGNPGCRIVPYRGKLWFEDYPSGHPPRDCFNMVQDYYGVGLKEAIQIICKHFFLSSDLSEYTPVPKSEFKGTPKARAEISYQERVWERRDMIYWSKSLITIEQLEKDGIKPLRNFTITNSEGNRISFSPYDVTYLYSFDSRYKIYRPLCNNRDYRFMTNCNQNDIGNLSKISIFGDELTITKSYKDHRVLKNALGTEDVIWLQNEVVIPDVDILIDLSVRFKKINILYDNDRQGIEGSNKLAKAFMELDMEVGLNRVYLPLDEKFSYKDPALFVNKEGMEDLRKVLKQLNINGTTARTREDTGDCPFLMA